jgi:hypothetical protein
VISDPGPAEVDEELLAFMRRALADGVGALRRHGGSLVPFAVSETGGHVHVEVFSDGEDVVGSEGMVSLERAMERMRERAPLLTFEAERCAVVYEGYLTVGRRRSAAVFVEGYRQGMGTSVTMAQRYAGAGRLRRFRTLGRPVLLEQGRHFLR